MSAAAQVRLANDIAAQFHYLPPEQAAQAVAQHLTTFWDPRMRRQLRELVDDDGPVQDELDPIAVAAARLLPA